MHDLELSPLLLARRTSCRLRSGSDSNRLKFTVRVAVLLPHKEIFIFPAILLPWSIFIFELVGQVPIPTVDDKAKKDVDCDWSGWSIFGSDGMPFYFGRRANGGPGPVSSTYNQSIGI